MRNIWMIILTLVLAIGVFTGCGPNEKKIQNDYIKILNQPATEETIKEAAAFLDRYIDKVDDRKASEMVIQLEHYILSYDQAGVDYTAWIKKYKSHIIPALSAMYKMQAKEQKSPILEDAVLQVSWAELAKRTYDMEQLIHQYSGEEMIKEDALWIYGNDMNAMIMGSNGSPVFDYKTHQFSGDAQKAYTNFINKYPDSVTTWALTEYFSYLNSIDYSMDYNDKVSSKLFFDTCSWLVSESGKRVYQ